MPFTWELAGGGALPAGLTLEYLLGNQRNAGHGCDEASTAFVGHGLHQAHATDGARLIHSDHSPIALHHQRFVEVLSAANRGILDQGNGKHHRVLVAMEEDATGEKGGLWIDPSPVPRRGALAP